MIKEVEFDLTKKSDDVIFEKAKKFLKNDLTAPKVYIPITRKLKSASKMYTELISLLDIYSCDYRIDVMVQYDL